MYMSVLKFKNLPANHGLGSVVVTYAIEVQFYWNCNLQFMYSRSVWTGVMDSICFT